MTPGSSEWSASSRNDEAPSHAFPGAPRGHLLSLFYSYSHKDEALRDKLETYLSFLKRQGFIGGWHDRPITAGTEWEGQLDQHLGAAKVIRGRAQRGHHRSPEPLSRERPGSVRR